MPGRGIEGASRWLPCRGAEGLTGRRASVRMTFARMKRAIPMTLVALLLVLEAGGVTMFCLKQICVVRWRVCCCRVHADEALTPALTAQENCHSQPALNWGAQDHLCCLRSSSPLPQPGEAAGRLTDFVPSVTEQTEWSPVWPEPPPGSLLPGRYRSSSAFDSSGIYLRISVLLI